MTDTPPTTSAKKTVLVIEDDLFLIQAYKIKLEKENLEVWLASDGAEARKMLEKEPPNVVLLDLMLPGISGFDILESIRKDSRWMNVPVLILTNLGSPADIERGQALKATDYIIKANTKIEDIMSKVKKFL